MYARSMSMCSCVPCSAILLFPRDTAECRFVSALLLISSLDGSPLSLHPPPFLFPSRFPFTKHKRSFHPASLSLTLCSSLSFTLLNRRFVSFFLIRNINNLAMPLALTTHTHTHTLARSFEYNTVPISF